MNSLTPRPPRLLWLTGHHFDTVKKGQLFLPSTQRSYLRSPWLSATIAVFNLLMQCTPPYSSSKGSGTLLTFWREPLPVGISSTTTSHVDTPSLRYRHTTIQTYHDPAGGQRHSAREFVSYNLTLEAFKATYAEPMLPFEVEGLEPQGNNDCRVPLFKKARSRHQTARLTAGEQ